MELIHGLDKEIPKNSIVSIGSFDGIHLGHKRIISIMRRLAKQVQGTSCLITFEPHPRKLIYHDGLVHTISSYDEKARLLASIGLDRMYLLRFTKELSQIPADDFFHKIILESFKPVHFVMGYDNSFGKGRKGDFEFMKNKSLRYGFGLSKVTPKVVGGKAVSSSRIRYAIRVGELDVAQRLLGRRFSFQGEVVKGKARGKGLGFPTANIRMDDPDKILPPDGVYEILVRIPGSHKTHRGLLNIGYNPTFENTNRSVEAHILDFTQEIYGQILECVFVQHIRGEVKFSSKDALVEQIKKDVELVRNREMVNCNPIPEDVEINTITGDRFA